jgi:hypothetical protein
MTAGDKKVVAVIIVRYSLTQTVSLIPRRELVQRFNSRMPQGTRCIAWMQTMQGYICEESQRGRSYLHNK